MSKQKCYNNDNHDNYMMEVGGCEREHNNSGLHLCP